MKNSEIKEEDLRNWTKGFQYAIAALSIIAGAIILSVFVLKVQNEYSISGKGTPPDMAVNGQIGDFIGGVVGTFFSLAGVFLLFNTLTAQRQFFKQEIFESRFFEYIKMHRENVSEMVIADAVRGRSCFKYMISELRFIYRIVEFYALEIAANKYIINEKYTINEGKDYLRIAYLIMFFGIGYSSERQLAELLNEDELDLFKNKIKPDLEKVQQLYENRSRNFSSIQFTCKLNIPGIPDGFDLETRFYPFDGHATRLGHYFRTIFQIVKYVSKQPLKELPQEEKYQYLKSLRATFSNHEQLLMYYNSLSRLGLEWNSEGLISQYALIKNLPLGLVDIGIHPHEVLGIKNKDGKFLFETDEIQEQMKHEV